MTSQNLTGFTTSIPPHPIYTTTGSTQTDYVYDGSMLVEEIIRHFDANGNALDTPTTITYDSATFRL